MKSLINIDAQKGLEIKRSENDLTVEYVENKGLETMEGMTSIEVGKKYLSQLFQISDQKKSFNATRFKKCCFIWSIC